MKNFKYKGFTYSIIIRPHYKGNKKYECLRWMNGLRNLWERISYEEYIKTKRQSGQELDVSKLI